MLYVPVLALRVPVWTPVLFAGICYSLCHRMHFKCSLVCCLHGPCMRFASVCLRTSMHIEHGVLNRPASHNSTRIHICTLLNYNFVLENLNVPQLSLLFISLCPSSCRYYSWDHSRTVRCMVGGYRVCLAGCIHGQNKKEYVEINTMELHYFATT